MTGPPEGKQAGQQNLSDHGQHTMGGGDDKSSQESNPNDTGFKYNQLGDDKSNKTDKEMYGQARKNGQGDDHKGLDYTGAPAATTKSTSTISGRSTSSWKTWLKQRRATSTKLDASPTRKRMPKIKGERNACKSVAEVRTQLHDETKQHYQAVRQYSDNLQNIIKQYNSNEHDAMITFKDFQGKL